MPIWRRAAMEEGDELVEKRRRHGATLAALSLVLFLVLLAGGITLLAVTTEPVHAGSYTLLGPNVKKAGDLLIWFGSGQGPRINARALTVPAPITGQARLSDRWVFTSRATTVPVSGPVYLSIPSGNGFVSGRLLVDFYGFRLITR